jgi:hypothetical protein
MPSPISPKTNHSGHLRESSLPAEDADQGYAHRCVDAHAPYIPTNALSSLLLIDFSRITIDSPMGIWWTYGEANVAHIHSLPGNPRFPVPPAGGFRHGEIPPSFPDPLLGSTSPVDLRGVEPRLHPCHGCVIPLHYRPKLYIMCPRRESNSHFLLRTEQFYPLNYEGNQAFCES